MKKDHTVPLPIKVFCRSGHKADEYPIRLEIDNERIEIKEITDRWYQYEKDSDLPPSDYFKIRLADEQTIIIKHELKTDEWFLIKTLPL
jgi:hypothetical protein